MVANAKASRRGATITKRQYTIKKRLRQCLGYMEIQAYKQGLFPRMKLFGIHRIMKRFLLERRRFLTPGLMGAHMRVRSK
jgi:hypothetical protein